MYIYIYIYIHVPIGPGFSKQHRVFSIHVFILGAFLFAVVSKPLFVVFNSSYFQLFLP